MSKLSLDSRLQLFYENGLDLKKRQIIFTSDINQGSMSLLIKNLIILKNAGKEPINILYSSDGGGWEAGMSAFDVITSIKQEGIEVNFFCIGLVASMGVVLLQAASNRFCSPNASFLIHNGSSSINGDTTYKETQSLSKYEQRQTKHMLNLLGKTKEGGKKLQKLIDKRQEVYFNSEEALQFNIVDKIITQIE